MIENSSSKNIKKEMYLTHCKSTKLFHYYGITVQNYGK